MRKVCIRSFLFFAISLIALGSSEKDVEASLKAAIDLTDDLYSGAGIDRVMLELYFDPKCFVDIDKSAIKASFEGLVKFDDSGRPINPKLKDGMPTGKGPKLWHWGPNHTADAVVTRLNPDTNRLEMLLIKRSTGEWAFPGGFIDGSESGAKAAIRELAEEAGLVLEGITSRSVYKGYVDDPRNAQNAWIETQAEHFHLTGKNALLKIQAADDATAAQWVDVEDSIPPLYASHSEIAAKALGR